jgi:outer membrane protein assembly factor BamE (lipoprotein component of BamABCDE complex)
MLGRKCDAEKRRFVKTDKLLFAMFAAFVFTACEPRIDTRGHVPDAESLAKIKPGLVSRSEVKNILGSPSSIARFDGETWYYITTRTETVAFYEPTILEQNVVAIALDQTGFVADVRQYGLEDLNVVEPIDRETPTAGKKLGFFEQLIGNVGRFAKGGSGAP